MTVCVAGSEYFKQLGRVGVVKDEQPLELFSNQPMTARTASSGFWHPSLAGLAVWQFSTNQCSGQAVNPPATKIGPRSRCGFR